MTELEPNSHAIELDGVFELANAGQTIRIGCGPLEGLDGVIVERRDSGRYLVQIGQGVFVETYLIEPEPGDGLA